MGKRLAFKYKHRYTPTYEEILAVTQRKLRQNGDYRLADEIGQIPLITVRERLPIQLDLFPKDCDRGAGDEPQ